MNAVYVFRKGEWKFHCVVPDQVLDGELKMLDKDSIKYNVVKIEKADIAKIEEIQDTLNK